MEEHEERCSTPSVGKKRDLLKLHECSTEIRTFVAENGAYYFVACDGRRGDIIRCQTFQPDITDFDNYSYYMWVEALQGFFLLRQRFFEGQAHPWELTGEFELDEPGPGAFDWLSDRVRAMLESGELS